MSKYTKIVQSGRLLEFYEYQYPPNRHLGVCRRDRGKANMRQRRNRRSDNVSRLCAKFKRLVWANLDDRTGCPALLTLTFRDIVSVAVGFSAFSAFRRQIETRFVNTRYIAVPEFGTKGTCRLHFHVLIWGLDDETIWKERQTRKIASLWGNGFVDILKTDGSIKLGGYLAKYLSKALFDERLIGKKAYSTSRNIKRPMSTNSPVVLSYAEETWELSTVAPLLVKSYETEWMGRCNYTMYKL